MMLGFICDQVWVSKQYNRFFMKLSKNLESREIVYRRFQERGIGAERNSLALVV